VPDLNIAEKLGARADDHTIADRGVSFASIVPGAAERHTVIDQDIIAYDRRFSDDHTHSVVDKKPPTDDCGGVNLDAGEKPGELGEQARKGAKACSP